MGDAVGVGCGIFNFRPTYSGHETARLFARIILLIDTLKVAAMMLQLSPETTVYSTGGSGVKVGIGVSVGVIVGVTVIVGVIVVVADAVGMTTV